MKLDKCLACGKELEPLLDWGKMPLANNYNIKETYPLKLNRCVSCCHLQLDECVNPEILFKNYPYHSGTSKTSLDYFKWFAEEALRIKPDAKVVLDIACNDGAQLDAFKELGLETHGIDPAENLLPISTAKGHDVMCYQFPDKSINFGTQWYDIFVAQNVLAHVPDPLEFMKECKEMMKDRSVLMVATSQANMISGTEFDTIYHEHISYFNTLSMQRLCERAGLFLEDVFTNPIHGTSYIFVIRKVKTPNPVEQRVNMEAYSMKLYDSFTYEKWKLDCEMKSNKIKLSIDEYRAKGYRIVGCGAAAKGITFLNVTKTKVHFIVDTTPDKWYANTCDTTIYPFEYLKTLPQDEKVLFVLMAWNFAPEIKQNILKYRSSENDVFITTNDNL